MSLDAEQCYRALRARDARFDGLFFVAVESTGIYCRPICPARTPARARCRFFAHPAAAERAGFRACLRCRPELAPGHARVDALPRLVRAASERIAAGYLDTHAVDELAAELGVSARHLRRATETALGASPIELANTRRLATAKRLLHDTSLSMAEVAFASGFASVRRFNHSVRERFGLTPTQLRHGGRGAAARSSSSSNEDAGAPLCLRLDYRPPLYWPALLDFLRARAVPGVEAVVGDRYRRSAAVVGPGGNVHGGWVEVRPDPRRPRLLATLSLELGKQPMAVVARLRALFDLDAEPAKIAEQLGDDPRLAPLLAARPGLRVPGAFDRFEVAVRVVLGQQISVAAAKTLAARLVDRFGAALPDAPAGLERLFPAPARLAAAPVEELRAIGLTQARARTLAALARAVARGALTLDADPATVEAALRDLPGIGPWSAQTIAMRALRWPDAFPAGDLVLRRALGCTRARDCERAAERWRPWRAYAVMHLWTKESSTP
jgi:AraC family transcriptional regulator of adaptative response / DNA-3-methyladenine glycosylase II